MSTKPPFPGCELSLKNYYDLKKRLYNYFFHGIELKITNTQTINAYSDVYNLINNNAPAKTTNQKKYQLYEETLFNNFKNDLTAFCQQIRQNLISKKGISSPVEQLRFYYQWIEHFTWFLRWIHKMLSSIEKNISVFNRTSLYYTGLMIMKGQIIQPLYVDIFRLLMANLELFKQGLLKEHTQLQFMIQLIGMCGFEKYFSVKLERNQLGFFNFVSVKKQTQLKAEDQYEKDYFLSKFTHEYVKYLKTKYSNMSQQMIKMSTTEYVNKAVQILEKQTKAAEFFYPNIKVKTVVIRSVEQTLIANKCKELICNQKSGIFVMIQNNDIDGLKNLYRLVKRTSQQRIFGQAYQQYIEKFVQEQILMKITPEDEKMAKKQTVNYLINSLYEFYSKMEKITKIIIEHSKDPYDLVLPTCQSNGFQIACNKTNTVCVFLAYYCDSAMKKQQISTDSNSKQLTLKISKMLKFLYSLDQFLKIYQKMLGVRILYDQFKNRDSEMQVINMLKNEVGVAQVAKISTMLQDLKFSENFNSEKQSIFRNNIPFNFQINLLTSGGWLIQDYKNGKKLIPPELMRAVQVFEHQYNQTYPGRQITWSFNFGRAIVQAKFDDQSKALLLLNNYQLLVLLSLKRKNFIEVKICDLIAEIKPEEEHGMLASIMMMVKRNLLKKQGNPLKIQSKNQSISFNFEHKPKVPKIGCFEVPRFAVEKMNSTSNEISGERGIVIQANIVKLMKTKRVMRYQDIVTQVIGMCRTFKAQVPMVKAQIQACIHKQYLERDPKQFNTMIYKP